ncbi:hypothetical protein BD309DRAFT_966417 [Dichomitus squalens]|nr:hypothetical protein BD309DRAFT_966417 [Dichomitus squalens]
MLADFASRTEPIGARGQRKRTMPGLDCSIKATNDAAGGSGATGGGDGDGTVCVGRDSAAAAAGGLCSGYQSPPPPPWGGVMVCISALCTAVVSSRDRWPVCKCRD